MRLLSLLSCLCLSTFAATAAAPEWIVRSNAFSAEMIDEQSAFVPENASQLGQDRFDTRVADLAPHRFERFVAQTQARLAALRKARDAEKDRRVREDLDILISAEEHLLANARVRHKYLFEFIDPSEIVNGGLQSLLDARNKPERQARALVRLRRYAGLEAGYTPIATLARQYTEEELARPGCVGPYVDEVKQRLANTDLYLKGLADLFRAAKLTGWEHDLDTLATQLRGYRDWARGAVVPRARTELRLPPEVYATQLAQVGVDMAPGELIDRASADFQEVRGEMQELAARIAAERHLPSSDYRDVIRALKKEQIAPGAMVERYRERLHDIEAIIRREHLVTLPNREMNIRAATEAESAAVPAPHMRQPRLIGNTGEYGEFVITLSNPHAKSGAPMDDFGYDAVTWTLTAHEARPGHELQFASMVEQGVSIARAVFAFNSANVEGWGLYAEWITEPYMPPEGQLIAMDYRLFRIARAMLDPMVNLGRMTPAQAKGVLMDDVGLSEPFAQEEVDRFAFIWPGQATSYYYGLQKLRALRTQVELALGPRFDARAFHDFVIAQGLLPPPVLERTVMQEFVPAQRAKG